MFVITREGKFSSLPLYHFTLMTLPLYIYAFARVHKFRNDNDKKTLEVKEN